jgi:hypothetical protein
MAAMQGQSPGAYNSEGRHSYRQQTQGKWEHFLANGMEAIHRVQMSK